MTEEIVENVDFDVVRKRMKKIILQGQDLNYLEALLRQSIV